MQSDRVGIDDGETHTVDCFECAINLLAPECDHCGTKIIGHGLQAKADVYCCAHCAREKGIQVLRDNEGYESLQV